MPRTQKYDVTESLAPFASSQQTILSHNNDNNLHRSEDIYNSNEIPVRKKKIPLGWLIAGLFGAMSIAFILCVSYVHLPGVPESRPFTSSKVLQNKGYLKVYPYLPDENTFIPGMYSIPLPINSSLLHQIDDIINSYPENPNNYQSCFVSSPSYNRPCFFERIWLGGKCTKEDQFGYLENNGTYSPCILLQITDSFDWRPIIYKRNDVEDSWKQIYDPTFASLGCAVQNKEQQEKFQSIDIFPIKGFPTEFFPVTNFNSSIYLPPSVMIKVNKIKVGDTVTMECWLRASNAYLLEDSGQITISFLQNKEESSTTVAAPSAEFFSSEIEKTSSKTSSGPFVPSTSQDQTHTTATIQSTITTTVTTVTTTADFGLNPKN